MSPSWVSAQQLDALLGSTPHTFPVYADVARRVRLLIVDGRLSLGVRMPSERDLAGLLGLSRSTVSAVYSELRNQGYLRARPGSGNFVALPVDHRVTPSAWGNAHLIADERGRDGDPISLAYASAPALPEIAGAFATAAARLPELLTRHGYFPDGVEELRVALADWFSGRGLRTSPDQLVITAGALSALNIVARTVLSPGDRVLLESPSYPNAVSVLQQLGRPVAYSLPASGWDAADVELVLRQTAPRMSYLIPDFHNPTGAWMTDETRVDVAAALHRSRSTTVIDETLVELSLDGGALRTPLAAHLPDAVTVGSASKAFWGGLRIGWIRAPRDLVRPLIETRALLDLGAAPYEQLVLTELLRQRETLLQSHRARLRQARDQLGGDLAAALPEWAVNSPAGGLSLWVTLPDESSSRLAAQAEQHGLVLTAGPRFFVSGGGERQLRLPYTAAPEVLSEAVRRLSAAWRDVQSSRPGRRGWATSGITA